MNLGGPGKQQGEWLLLTSLNPISSPTLHLSPPSINNSALLPPIGLKKTLFQSSLLSLSTPPIMVGSTLPSHKPTIKFLCSYGGRILPRYPDGKLRYYGGETRVLSVERSISFSDLLVKLEEMFGTSVNLRCQFPTEDLDALVSITSDEDLANLIEEYDRIAAAAAPSSLKIRAFLSGPKTTKNSSLPQSPASSSSNDSTSPKSPPYSFPAGGLPPRCPISTSGRCVRHASRPPLYPIIGEKAAGKIKYAYQYHHDPGNGGHVYFVHNGHHWQ